MGLPIVDWNDRDSGDEIVAAGESHGFFYLTGHGVPGSLVTSLRRLAERFFSLPEELKLEVHFEKAGKQRGYIPSRGESSNPDEPGDEKEALDFTYPIPPRGVSDPVAHRMYGENLWPAELPELEPAVLAYFDEMIRLGRGLFERLATGLSLPPGYFRDETDRPIAQLRLLHYPRGLEGPGIGAHCDYECFTLLEPGDAPGLQILSPEGSWTSVAPVPGTFVVNFGEMLARWTNGRIRATPHRVVRVSERERFTIPFFFGTNYETVIECLPSCCGPDNPPRFEPIPAGEFLARRLNAVYGSLPGAGTLQS